MALRIAVTLFLFATLAEIHHFHQIPIRDFKSQMQHFLQQQVIFSPKVTQNLEVFTNMVVFHDWTWIVDCFPVPG